MENQPEYEIQVLDGIEYRCVKPYDHNYVTHCKERWRDMNILTMFLKEFKAYSEEYYRQAITLGLIQVNYKKVALDYILRNGDTITHTATRSEPPVFNRPIKIIHDSPNLLIVYKPASMPVHPSGAYYKNSMLYILQNEMSYKELHLIHRLDRVTSGIIVLTKNSRTAASLTRLFEKSTLKKYYLARVKGKFPTDSMEIKEKILCVDHKNGVYKVDPAGKDSYTIVKHMFYDEKTDESVVECRLITGRTHQIRVHLSYIGHPIANDICYGGQCSNPPIVPDAYYKLRFGDQVVKLEKTSQLEIFLCSYRYILTQNLDFSAPQPLWAQKVPSHNT